MARYVGMYIRKNNKTKKQFIKNSNGPNGGCVIGFSWKEITEKFESCGINNVSHITIDEWGIHVWHDDISNSDESNKIHEIFKMTPGNKLK